MAAPSPADDARQARHWDYRGLVRPVPDAGEEQEQADLARPAKRGTALARVHGLDAPLKSHTALLRDHAGQRVSVSAVSPVDPIQSRADDTLVEALVKPFAANLSAHEHAALARLDSDGEVDGPSLGKHGWASKICCL